MKGKIIEAAFVLAAAIVLAFCFVSCQNTGGRSKEYVSGDGSFSITVPGEWTVGDDGRAEYIVLDNSDMTFSILVQRFQKTDPSFGDFQSFVDYYKESVLQSMIEAAGEPQQESLSIEGMEQAVAESYEISEADSTVKAFVAYIESETAYYVYTLSGTGEVYDQQIEAQRSAVSSLKEK